jgi:hypothetical protein
VRIFNAFFAAWGTRGREAPKSPLLFSLPGQMSILAVFLDHATLGFALGFGVLAICLVLPFLHLLRSSKLCFLAGDLIGVTRQSQARA